MKIIIGKDGARNVTLNLDQLLRGRGLVQANSGKGKSWLLRRIAEQLFGKVQIIIIDTEGEFSTLREKFGFVLVGKGGETPADPRSAALVAHKLLELRASAVCDLYEMKPKARHEWVRRFIEAVVDAPKNLWHPCIFIFDETAMFCPEKGFGESEASEAVIGLGTRGRKRGFAILAATQRLGGLSKNLAAELLNVFIGGTFIDIDRKRAADTLGIYGKDKNQFFDEIKMLKPGNFFCLGPAISEERILAKVGDVETTHPEAGSYKHAAKAPPAPAKIKALLPKLSDLPKEAEEQAQTVGEMKKEIRALKASLRSGPVAKMTIVEKVADPKAIERAVKLSRREFEKALVTVTADRKALLANGGKLAKALQELATAALKQFSGKEFKMPEIAPVVFSPSKPQEIQVRKFLDRPVSPIRDTPKRMSSNEDNGSGGEITPYQREILRGLAELEAIGKTEPTVALAGVAAGKSATSSTFERYTAHLKKLGLVSVPGPRRLALTDEGRAEVPHVEGSLGSAELQERCRKLLTPYQVDILNALLDVSPKAISREELGERSAKQASSSTFERYLAALRSMEIVEYEAGKKVKAADWLFVD